MSQGLKNPGAIFVGACALQAVATLSAARPEDVRCGTDSCTAELHYGMMQLENGEHIHLYAKPETVDADTVSAVARGAGLGVVALLDNRSPYPLRDMNFYLHTFEHLIRSSSVAVGVTCREPFDSYSIDDYQAQLIENELHVPVFDVDVTGPEDLHMLVEALLLSAAARQAAG